MSQNNFLYDLRTKGTRYGILKKKFFSKLDEILVIFWDFLRFFIFTEAWCARNCARAPDRLKNYSYDVKCCSKKI